MIIEPIGIIQAKSLGSTINTCMNTLNSVISALFEAVSDEKFWDFVRRCDWLKDYDFERIKMKMLRTLTKQEVESYRDVFGEFRNKLSVKLDNVVSGVSDDSYSDLLAHVVGSGKELYDAVMDDPSIAQKIIDNYDYRENFSYSFPYDDDWNMLDKKPHIERAQEAVEELSNPDLVKAIKSEAAATLYKNILNRLKLVSNDKFEKAVEGWSKQSYRGWSAFTDEVFDVDPDIHHGPPNILNDVKQYFAKR